MFIPKIKIFKKNLVCFPLALLTVKSKINIENVVFLETNLIIKTKNNRDKKKKSFLFKKFELNLFYIAPYVQCSLFEL